MADFDYSWYEYPIRITDANMVLNTDAVVDGLNGDGKYNSKAGAYPPPAGQSYSDFTVVEKKPFMYDGGLFYVQVSLRHHGTTNNVSRNATVNIIDTTGKTLNIPEYENLGVRDPKMAFYAAATYHCALESAFGWSNVYGVKGLRSDISSGETYDEFSDDINNIFTSLARYFSAEFRSDKTDKNFPMCKAFGFYPAPRQS